MSVLGCRGRSRTRNCQLMRLMSCLYSTLPESAGAVNSGKGKTKNRVEQKKGDNKWKAEGGGKGVRMWNTPESHNLFRLLS